MQAGAVEVVSVASLVAYLTVLIALSVYGLHRWQLLRLARRHAGRAQGGHPVSDFLPRVTVQLPIYNERYVVLRLLRAVCRFDYPKDRLEIQVLDDSTDDTSARVRGFLAAARRRGFEVRHIRRARRAGFKAGALAAGLASARGEFIAVFDADFVPPPSFIRRALSPFADERVGLVQARWGYLNAKAAWLTRLQAICLDGHFLVEHLARNRTGCFFNFNGTAGLWRRSCIVDAGGWHQDTLTEDLDLSYRAQLRGWRFVFLPELVAPGELPEEMAAFKSQQHRWAKGSMQTARKLLPSILRAPLPWPVRIESFFHLTDNVAYLLMVLLSVLIWPAMLARQRLGLDRLVYADLPLLGLASLSVAAFYYHTQRRTGRGRVGSLIAVPAVMALGIGLSLNNAGAVISGLSGRSSPFVRTPKTGASDGRSPSRPPLPRYRLARSRLPWLEALFAAYCAAALADALRRGLWMWAPYLLIFAAGFAFTAVAGSRGLRARGAGW